MRLFIITATVAALSFSVATTSAQAQSRVRAGGLSCNLSPTVGLIIGSRQQVQCTFTPGGGGPVEYYSGHVNRLGLDLGVTAGGRMIWGVFARTAKLPPRTLAGTYVGASGDASLGLGGGANVLIGGFDRSFALQPVSIENNAGLNVAAGGVAAPLLLGELAELELLELRHTEALVANEHLHELLFAAVLDERVVGALDRAVLVGAAQAREQIDHAARLRGCTHVVLEVAENNEEALRFYKKRNFQKLDAAIFLSRKLETGGELLGPRKLKGRPRGT